MPEHRREKRLVADATAQIILPTHPPIGCRILDVSWSGARLRVGSVLGIPETFRLATRTITEPIPVKVVWRGANELGIAYL